MKRKTPDSNENLRGVGWGGGGGASFSSKYFF